MSPGVERVLMEQEMSSLRKQVAIAVGTAMRHESSCAESLADLETAEKMLSMQRANIRHMKGPADLVSMDEFKTARTILLQAETEVASIKSSLAWKRSELAKARAFIQLADEQMKKLQVALRKCGLVYTMVIKCP